MEKTLNKFWIFLLFSGIAFLLFNFVIQILDNATNNRLEVSKAPKYENSKLMNEKLKTHLEGAKDFVLK